ncbi:MAG: Gfo/Idh/MocA family protein [Tepidisphaerales bacterium]
MSPLRLGIIGTGAVVREIYQHLYFHSEYSPILSIEAAADPNEKALAGFCDRYNIPPQRRFASYQEMIAKVQLDAVQVNTPDSLHEAPTIFALEAGLEVILPKPLSDTIRSAHNMICAARRTGRVLAVDYHKRDDPRLKEAASRYQSGQYGRFQAAVFYMLDKLMVADPNYSPRFFASPDFASRNSPISFLTVHMADALLGIIRQKPLTVRATAWSQKLPSLTPIAVAGYDMVDTEVRFAEGGLAHIITGWHLPNAAHATTVQSARIICTDGLLDLGLDTSGFHELTVEGIAERNPLFRNFEPDGSVSGYGISHPGRLYQKLLKARRGELSQDQRQAMLDPIALGFWTTVILQAADRSLAAGQKQASGATFGVEIDVDELLSQELGQQEAAAFSPVGAA